MKQIIKPFILLILILGLFSLAACGDEEEQKTTTTTETETVEVQKDIDSDDYVENLNKAQVEFESAANELNLANPESAGSFANSLDSLIPIIDELVSDLDQITPPDKVETQHQELVTALESYKDVLDENIEALKSDNQEEVREAALKVSSESTSFATTFGETISEINSELGFVDPTETSTTPPVN